jgi:hypothetical protein
MPLEYFSEKSYDVGFQKLVDWLIYLMDVN